MRLLSGESPVWKVIDHQVSQCVLYTHGCLWIPCSDRVSYGHVQVHGHVHLGTVQLYIHNMWMCFLYLQVLYRWISYSDRFDVL